MYQGQGQMASVAMGYSSKEAVGQLATAARQLEVESEMERLASAVGSLGLTVEALMGRLEPVRNQCGSDEKACTNVPAPALCAHASAVRSQRQRVEVVRDMLQRALNELEL